MGKSIHVAEAASCPSAAKYTAHTSSIERSAQIPGAWSTPSPSIQWTEPRR